MCYNMVMERNLAQEKTEKIDNLVEDAKDAADIGHDTENQLSNNLISVTLAFIALITTAISISNVLFKIDFIQKILVMAAMVLFMLSIIVGLTNYFLNMKAHQESARLSGRKVRSVEAADTSSEVASVRRSDTTTRIARVRRRNNVMIMIQMLLLMVGLVCCVIFIGAMLFDERSAAQSV